MMISDDMVAQYQRDGAVCIRQLFRPPEIEELRAGIELILILQHCAERNLRHACQRFG